MERNTCGFASSLSSKDRSEILFTGTYLQPRTCSRTSIQIDTIVSVIVEVYGVVVIANVSMRVNFIVFLLPLQGQRIDSG